MSKLPQTNNKTTRPKIKSKATTATRDRVTNLSAMFPYPHTVYRVSPPPTLYNINQPTHPLTSFYYFLTMGSGGNTKFITKDEFSKSNLYVFHQDLVYLFEYKLFLLLVPFLCFLYKQEKCCIIE